MITGGYTMRAIAAVACLLATTTIVWGADLPQGYPPPNAPAAYSPPPSPPPVYDWTGLYVGGNGGYGFATASVTGTLGALSATESENLSGFVGGVQAGADYQMGPAVVGIEADFDGSTQSLTVTAPGITGTDKIPWLGSVRAVGGFAINRVFVYGTGGLGFGEFSSTVTAGGVSVTDSASRTAWVVGGGVEVGITPNLSARVEYLFFDTGSIPIGSVGALTVTGNVQDSVVRAGLNLRLPL